MTIIKGSTKRGQELIASARYFKGTTLDDVYGTYSKAKENAYEHCLARQEFFKGDNIHITGSNSNFFTVAFDGEYEGEKVVVIETHCNEYVVLVNQ